MCPPTQAFNILIILYFAHYMQVISSNTPINIKNINSIMIIITINIQWKYRLSLSKNYVLTSFAITSGLVAQISLVVL